MGMKSWRVFLVLAGLALGLAAGLVYGWLINPVEYVNTSPDTLRIDYQTDIVLMTANIYIQNLDSRAAIERLSLLGSQDIGLLVQDCLDYAVQMHFSSSDIANIATLQDAIGPILQEGME